MSEAVLGSPAIAYAPPKTLEAVGGADLGPVQPKERIPLLDVLRGFALFGILQVNWSDFEGILDPIILFFFEGKMRTIFSFLFGLGFALQLLRAQERKRPFVARYAWRSLLLLVIGCAHFAFIWNGDIVREYAVMSLTLLLVAKWRPKIVLGFAVGALVLAVVPQRLLPGASPASGSFTRRADPETAGARQMAERERGEHSGFVNRALADHGDGGGGISLVLAGRVRLLANEFRNLNIYEFIRGQLLSLFLLGLWVGHRRILHEPEKHMKLFWWVMGVGLSLGFFSNLYSALDWPSEAPILSAIPHDGLIGSIYYEVGNYLLALGYIAGVSLLVLRAPRVRGWLIAALAPIGRMGLTNYLMQSVILMTLLSGRGFGLGTTLHGWGLMLVMQLVFVAQILFSKWWFRHFHFGPVEWAWRSLTWGRVQPLRITAAQPATAT